MKPLGSIFQLISSLTIVLSGASSFADPNENPIEKFFLEPIPQRSAFADLYAKGGASGLESGRAELVRAAVRASPSLQAMANLGKQFFDEYWDLLQADISNSARALLLKRENEIIRRLKAIREQKAQRVEERPIPIWLMQSRNWEEALRAAGLPAGTSRESVMQRRGFDFQSEVAARAYNAAEFRRAAETMPTRVRVLKINVFDFKSLVSAEINAARIENFKSAARLAPSDAVWKLTSLNGDTISVAANDLERASVTFEVGKLDGREGKVADFDPNQTEETDSSLFKALREGTWKTDKKWIEKLARYLSDYPHFLPNWPFYRVRIRLPGGNGEFFMSELDFSRWLEDFRSSPLANPFQEHDRSRRQYVIAASRRDQILADLNATLVQYSDSDLNGLENRLTQFVESSKQRYTGKGTVEDLLASVNSENIRQDPYLHLYLTGIMINPKFWSFRERHDRMSLLAVLNPNDQSRISANSEIKIVEILKKQLEDWYYKQFKYDYKNPSSAQDVQNEARVSTRGPRSLRSWARSALYSAAIFGAFYGSDQLTGGNAMKLIADLLAQSPLLKSIAGVVGPVDIGLPKVPVSDSNHQIPPEISMNWNSVSKNYDLNDSSTQPRPFKVIQDSSSVRSGTVRYINLINNWNLPPEVVRGQVMDTESSSLREIPVTQLEPDDASPEALVLESAVLSKAVDGRLPIAQVSGYEIKRILMYDDERGTRVSHLPKIMKVSATGLTYALFNHEEISYHRGFSYRAEYLPKASRSNFDQRLMDLDRKSLKAVDRQLKDSGLIAAEVQVKNLLAQTHPISAFQIAYAISTSSLYSSRPPGWPQGPGNSFRVSTQYLHGTTLYYECTGAAEFERNFLNAYRGALPAESARDLFVEDVDGYTLSSSGEVSNIGHRHNFFGLHHVEDSAIELDATPTQVDSNPKFAPPPDPPQKPSIDSILRVKKEYSKPVPVQKMHFDSLPILPIRPKIENEPHDEETKPEPQSEVEADQAQVKTVSKTQKVKVWLKNLITPLVAPTQKVEAPPRPAPRLKKVKLRPFKISVERMSRLRANLLKALESARKVNPSLNRLNIAEFPGLEINALSVHLADWTEEKISDRAALDRMTKIVYRTKSEAATDEISLRLLEAANQEEAWAMGHLLKESEARFEKFMESIRERQKQNPKGREPLAFMEEPTLEEAIRDFYLYLNRLNWMAEPTFKMIEIDCEAELDSPEMHK